MLTDSRLPPLPRVVESDGRFYARWSRDDGMMRLTRRSPLEGADVPETAEDAFLDALRSDDAEIDWPDAAELRELARRVEAWFAPVREDAAARKRVVFALEVPEAGAENWRLVLKSDTKRVAERRALGQACRVFAPLRGMTDGVASLTPAEAQRFLNVGAPALRAAGYGVAETRGFAQGDVVAEAEIVSPERRDAQPDAKDAGLRTKVTIRVAGEKVTRAEVAFLLEQGTNLVFFRSRWIEVDRNVLKEALRVLDAQEKPMTEREAFAWAFGFRRPRGVRVAEVRAKGWFGEVLDELRAGDRFRPLTPPKGFHGKLRAYQKRGSAWLGYLCARGFGPLLADDMGLGKTVQVIAWLLARRRDPAAGPALIVAPVSVTMNWMRELAKFAPGWRVMFHQGKERLTDAAFKAAAAKCDAVVTGYPLLAKDFPFLAECTFSAFILDEAQKIKNPDTIIARAARAFPCDVRVALTGTPFENSALDLWSIEEFLNPGLLGLRAEFVRDYVKPVREDARSGACGTLRKMLQPFLLRRLKTDPGIAAELGPKREIREYCALSPVQRARYEAALWHYAEDRDAGRGRAAAGVVDAGRALALLTELKLICDGDDGTLHKETPLAGGKADRLDELLADIFAAGESCLVFTQYVRVGEKLKAHLEKTFARPVPFLHGGQSAGERDRQIAAFNAAERPTAFVLSLKAGGYGLNLTKATHVVHYDRWWNPAVENQATDRAHRIGQTRTVFVHLFISNGTLEDHIDELLESKRARAGELVASGEAFLFGLGEKAFGKAVALT